MSPTARMGCDGRRQQQAAGASGTVAPGGVLWLGGRGSGWLYMFFP